MSVLIGKINFSLRRGRHRCGRSWFCHGYGKGGPGRSTEDSGLTPEAGAAPATAQASEGLDVGQGWGGYEWKRDAQIRGARAGGH